MTTQLTDRIRLAELDLECFESGVTDQMALARLGAHQPTHPLLVSYWALRTSAALTALATCAALAMPLLSESALRIMATSTLATMLPGLTFAACIGFAVAAVAMRQAAALAGHMSPLLPGERKQHLHLVHSVQQLTAERRIRDRTTPAPARARLTAQVH